MAAPLLKLAAGIIALVALAIPAHAFGDECENAWFSRNKIMADAGYCFGSVLGRATFGNANCTGKNVRLSATQKSDVQALQAMENNWACSVDNSRPSIESELIKFLRPLDRQPVRDDFESACIGWEEPTASLFAGPDSSKVVGAIQPGNTISYSHLPADNRAGTAFVFTVVTTDEFNPTIVSAGWAPVSLVANPKCRSFAG
ncbi:MAG: DUF4453 domain-containing protein [Pseudomonadota bacterium]